MTFLIVSVVLLWILVLILAVLVVLLYRQFGLLYIGSGERVRMSGLPVGKRAPEGLIAKVEGQESSLDWRKHSGRGTLVVFGAPVCPICAELVQQLNDVADATQDLVDLVFVDRQLKGVRPMERDLPEPRLWTYAMSTDGSAHDAFDVEVSPQAFLLDDDGIVLGKGIPNTPANLLALVQQSIDEHGRLLLRQSGESNAPATISDGSIVPEDAKRLL